MSTQKDNLRAAAGQTLTLQGVACSRGGRRLFDGFDLVLAPGRLVWLRAANGAGKTTLLRAVAGLLRPDAGTIAWSRPSPVRFYLAHANGLKGDLTVIESLAHHAALHGLAVTRHTIDGAVARFGLDARGRAPVRALSQGQQRRVALAALALSPHGATWILDEPYDALDAHGTALVDALLATHADAGGNALVTSHVPPAGIGAEASGRWRAVALR